MERHHADPPARRWLLLLLLLGGVLYASLLLFWALSDSNTMSAASSESQSVQEAEAHAHNVRMLPTTESRARNWRCVGWRATGSCSPHGPREPQNDVPCVALVPNDAAGYCEVEDVDSGERFRVMRRYCTSLRSDAQFRCGDAAKFLDFPLETNAVVHKASSGFALPGLEPDTARSGSQDGIVIVVYPKLLASAYATIRALRELQDCRLPIEIWFRPKELFREAAALEPLRELAEQPGMGAITFREITDAWATGFGTKVFAIYHSNFDRVLFLDADNVPVKDPSYLFELQEFQDSGAVFWPDFWHPGHTIFNVNAKSLLWELLDMPFVNMFEQESGQLLIDRRRHAAPLELVRFYAFHQPNLLSKMKLVHGDKDLFRLAWLKLKAPFHMIQTPPAVAGKVINNSFCGMTMVQHDVDGHVLFLHRNSRKLTGGKRAAVANKKAAAIRRERNRLMRIKWAKNGQSFTEEPETPTPVPSTANSDNYPDEAIWTHLLSFSNTSRRAKYVIETYGAVPEFPEAQNCYGHRQLNKSEHFVAQEIANLSFAGLETYIRRFAMEAVQLQQAKIEQLDRV